MRKLPLYTTLIAALLLQSAEVLAQPPANDLCGDVVPEDLVLGETLTFIGDNTQATFAGDAEEGTLMDDFPFPNTWHAFTTTVCADVTVDYCATDAGWTNVWKHLVTDCPASTFIYQSAESNTDCTNGNWTFSFHSLPAGTYYLPIPNVGFGQGGGPYQVEVTAVSCANAVPENDLCSAITPVALSLGQVANFIGDNTNATFEGDAVEGTILADYPSPNTWHAFTLSECARVTMNYCGTVEAWSNVWRLVTTDCPAETIINASYADEETCTNGNWSFTFAELEAGTYYLPVPNVGFGQGGGAYNIEVAVRSCEATPPANDLCTNVVSEPLAIDETLSFWGDNIYATFEGDAEEGTLMDDFPFPNTWHAFTTSQCSDVTVSYCATGPGWSNVWRYLTTQCPAQTLIASSSSDTTSCANGNWTFTFQDLEPGTYYLPVPNVGFGQGGGAYHVLVSAHSCASAPPANDSCADLTPEALSSGESLTFTGDNTNATFEGDAVPGNIMSDYPSPNTWHAFTTSDCANVTVSYCGTDAGWSNVWRLLTTDCPAETLINASASDTTSCANGNWTFSFSELPAGTYYLPVPNVGFEQGGGPYTITVSAVPCGGSEVPTNDLCANVTPDLLGPDQSLTFNGNNTNATFEGDAVAGSELADNPMPNTWHAFTTTDCASIQVSYCNTEAGWSTVWQLLATDCPANTLIHADEQATSCMNGNWTFTFNELPAGTYYLPVPHAGGGQGGGAYSITVTSTPCAGPEGPPNDLCAQVTPVDLVLGIPTVFTGDNTNATLTGDALPGSVLANAGLPNTWHAFTTAVCADVSFTYCNTDAGWSTVWTMLAKTCPANQMVAADDSDNTSCSNGNWTFYFNGLPAGTYYLPVPNAGQGLGGGPYTIVATADSCLGNAILEQEATMDDAWTLFPNPTSGHITLKVTGMIGQATVRLIDLTGRTVESESMYLIHGGEYGIHLSERAVPGTYLLVITAAEGRSYKQVVLH